MIQRALRLQLIGLLGCGAGFVASCVAAPPDLARMREVIARVDLASLPLPPGATIGERTAVAARLTAPGAIEPNMAFFRQVLEKAGWREVKENGMPQMTDQYGQAMFSREGCQLSLSLSRNGGETSVDLLNMGSLDTRQLPRVLGATPLFESPFTTMLVTDASVLDTTNAVRAALQKDGWRQFGTDRPQDPQDDHQSLEFCFGPVEVGAFIGVAPAQGGRTTIQYSTRLLSAELPWPDDAQQVEFIDDMLRVRAASPAPFEGVLDFYREQMKRQGWALDAGWMLVGERSADVVFVRPQGEQRVRLQLSTTDEGTRIEMDGLSGAEFEQLLASAREAAKPDEEMPSEEPAAVAEANVRTLPLPPGAKDVEYDAEDSEVRYKVDAKPKALVKFYQEKLSAAGWSEDDGVNVSTSILAVCQMSGPQNEELSAMMMNPGVGGDTEVTITVHGMSFDEGNAAEQPEESAGDAPSPEEPSAADEPLRAENVDGVLLPHNRTSLMSEGSKFRRTTQSATPASLPRVVEFYREELAKQGWREQPGAAVSDDEARLRFSGAGGTLQLTLRAGDETAIEYAVKDQAAAKQAGILPKAGMAKVVFANMSNRALSGTFGGKPLKVGANVGVEKPDGPSFDLKPGKYALKIPVAGGQPITETVEVGADEAWGVMLDEQGPLILPLY